MNFLLDFPLSRKDAKTQSFDFQGFASLLLGVTLLSATALSAQSASVPLHAETYYLIERLAVTSGVATRIHPELKPFARQDVAAYADSLALGNQEFGQRTLSDVEYILEDNNDWLPKPLATTTPQGVFITDNWNQTGHEHKGVFNAFWKSKANFLEVNTPHFLLRVNPLLQFTFQKSQDEDGLFFGNQRGIEVRGEIDTKVYFSTNYLETQARFPQYFDDWVDAHQAVPGNGLYKRFESKLFDSKKALDFGNAVAYVGVRATQHISVELGHGRHFIGNGYRSLFLSDFANNYFYLKLNTRVWKFQYQNLFLELSPSTPQNVAGSQILPKKYAAMHYLSCVPSRNGNFAFGFFEATVFNRSQQFELQYLNPIILYRAIENSIGSPDNVLIGVDFRWNFLRRFQLYGQAMIDEFNFKYIFNSKQAGWRGNKQAVQLGLKWFNFMEISHLDLQAEVNIARPYIYSHADTLNSYTHNHQPLAHPLGGNFREYIGLLRWQPFKFLTLSGRYLHQEYGENSPGNNWGGDPLLSNHDFVSDFGNSTGQGVGVVQEIIGGEMTWQFYHNMFLDLKYFTRKKNSVDDARDSKTSLFGVGFRMNVWNTPLDF